MSMLTAATAPDFAVIDAHHHLWDLSAVAYPWLMERGQVRFFGDPSPIQRNYLLDEFRRDAGARGVRGSVHIQVGAADAWQEATWVQQQSEAAPDWPMAQVAFCDLTRPDLPEALAQFASLSSLKGLRQIIGRAPGEDAKLGTNALLDNPAFLHGLRALAEHGLSFDLQLIPELMAKAAAILAQAPDTKIALCHAGSPYDRSPVGLAAWAEQLRALSALPQVSIKLSGLGMFDHNWTTERFAPIVEACLEQFGPQRCMFGSNFPVDSLYSDYTRMFEAHWSLVPPSARRAVFHYTAAAFYGLQLAD